MLGHAQLYHARDLRERRRGEGAEHRSPDVVRGQKASLLSFSDMVVLSTIDKPDYHLDGGLRYQRCPVKSA
jgi:hypothetical protein